MRRQRSSWRFDTPEGIAIYQQAMRRALSTVNINRPFGRPLVPIPELENWHERTCLQLELSPAAPRGGVS